MKMMTNPSSSELSEKSSRVLRETMQWSTALISNAHAILKDWSLAEDAFQEMLIEVNMKVADYDESRPLLPWVRQILRFKSLNLLRKHNKEISTADQALIEIIDSRFEEFISAHQADELDRRKRVMRSCIAKLGANSRDLLYRYYSQGVDGEQLAGQLNRTANAIRIAVSRIRNQLKQCVGQA